MRLIASNAGVEGDVIIEKLLGQPFQIGYNAVRYNAPLPVFRVLSVAHFVLHC